MKVRTHYYQQFDADYSLDVPGEGYGGWKDAELEISPEHTAVVVMHAWDCGTPEEYPGWFRACEYLPRSYEICRRVFPPLLAAVRASPLPLFHVVGAHEYYKDLPGHKIAVEHSAPERPRFPQVDSDPVLEKLQQFKGEHIFVGPHNADDVARGWKKLDFPPEARPRGDEPVAENGPQLFGVCKKFGINHLIYAGFAVNYCLAYSPGGMIDMCQYGLMCSAFRDAVTAVENKETARHEWGKQAALWRVSMAYGYVFDTEDFIQALPQAKIRTTAR